MPLRKLTVATLGVLLCAALALAPGALGKVSARASLHSRTVSNLRYAMNTESFAYGAYNAYGDVARADGRQQLASLFATAADIEFEDHFASEAQRVGLVGTDTSNLRAVIAAEKGAIANYTKWADQVRVQGCAVVANHYQEVVRDETTHRDLFTAALRALKGQGQVPAAPRVEPVTIQRTKPACNDKVTPKTLDQSMHDEAMAWAQYTLFARAAANAGHGRLAALFADIASVELRDHFALEANLAGFVHSDAENVRAVIADEAGAVAMYGRFARQADAAGDRAVGKLLREIRSDEAGHRRAFTELLSSL